jgi:hypothetical protein
MICVTDVPDPVAIVEVLAQSGRVLTPLRMVGATTQSVTVVHSSSAVLSLHRTFGYRPLGTTCHK